MWFSTNPAVMQVVSKETGLLSGGEDPEGILRVAQDDRGREGVKILVTGFEPWGDRESNSSGDVAASMEGERIGERRLLRWYCRSYTVRIRRFCFR